MSKSMTLMRPMKLRAKVQFLFIVMGVSGTGKSSLAEKMAEELALVFVDADDFHSVQAKQYMAKNKPLTDEMRAPWLLKITQHLTLLAQEGRSVVLAYSGLKSAHRDLFRTLPYLCHFFYLTAPKEIISERMAQRKNHFFSADLLDSQLAAMEAPSRKDHDVEVINIDSDFLTVSNEINTLAKLTIRGVIDA